MAEALCFIKHMFVETGGLFREKPDHLKVTPRRSLPRTVVLWSHVS